MRRFKYNKVHLQLQCVADWTKTETVGVSSGLREVFIINKNESALSSQTVRVVSACSKLTSAIESGMWIRHLSQCISAYDKEKKTGSWPCLSFLTAASGRCHERIMPVISSYLSCFAISYTPLIDTINIYFHDYKIRMHCLKVSLLAWSAAWSTVSLRRVL